MKRYLILLGIAASIVCCNGAFADPPQTNATDTAIVEGLDAILKRLYAIEERLANVEAEAKLFSDWTVDDRGVMRLSNGRPIGLWGIDVPVIR